jgi:hypothetical protein
MRNGVAPGDGDVWREELVGLSGESRSLILAAG